MLRKGKRKGPLTSGTQRQRLGLPSFPRFLVISSLLRSPSHLPPPPPTRRRRQLRASACAAAPRSLTDPLQARTPWALARGGGDGAPDVRLWPAPIQVNPTVPPPRHLVADPLCPREIGSEPVMNFPALAVWGLQERGELGRDPAADRPGARGPRRGDRRAALQGPHAQRGKAWSPSRLGPSWCSVLLAR
jgi:hypothetical protein